MRTLGEVRGFFVIGMCQFGSLNYGSYICTMICTRCNEDKSSSCFHIATRRKDGSPIYRKYCNLCYKKVKDVRNRCVKRKFLEYKESLHCSKCGISFKNRYWICDFHHIDPRNKNFNLSSIFSSRPSFARVMEEVSKCIPLCANCHRDVHNENMV